MPDAGRHVAGERRGNRLDRAADDQLALALAWLVGGGVAGPGPLRFGRIGWVGVVAGVGSGIRPMVRSGGWLDLLARPRQHAPRG